MIRYLRISITNLCNMRCRYCMPKGYRARTSDTLTPSEIKKVVDTATLLGIDTIRITGGEPLLKDDITFLTRKISSNSKIKNIALTTNGSLIAERVGELKSAGIKSVNISLDTLKQEKYREISGKDFLPDVLDGIKVSRDTFDRVKINCVVMRHMNDDEIVSFCRFADENGVIVRFIEYVPHLDCSLEQLLPGTEILQVIEKSFGNIQKISDRFGAGPANYYKADGLDKPFGIISAVTSPPCHSCNRLRLTADGRLLPCLYATERFDLKNTLRRGEDITPIFLSAMAAKKCTDASIRSKVNLVEVGG